MNSQKDTYIYVSAAIFIEITFLVLLTNTQIHMYVSISTYERTKFAIISENVLVSIKSKCWH